MCLIILLAIFLVKHKVFPFFKCLNPYLRLLHGDVLLQFGSTGIRKVGTYISRWLPLCALLLVGQ